MFKRNRNHAAGSLYMPQRPYRLIPSGTFFAAESDPVDPPATPPANNTAPDAAFQRLLDRNNQDGIGLARQLFTENYDYRQTNRDLQTQLDAARGALPGEGTVVLSGDEAAAWQALGLSVTDVQTAVTERDELRNQVQTATRDTMLRDAAEAAGYKPSVLRGLDTQAGGLTYEVREVDGEGGAKVRQAMVVPAEGDAVPLADYATEHWGDFLPALAPAQGGQGNNGQQQPAGGVPFVRQGTGKAAGSSILDTFISEKNAAATKAAGG